jgi:hypothetical protein
MSKAVDGRVKRPVITTFLLTVYILGILSKSYISFYDLLKIYVDCFAIE